MNTTTTNMHQDMIRRRHQNPRCVCSACRAFDQSSTLSLHRVATASFVMSAIDTETSERCTYLYQHGVLLTLPEDPSRTPEPARSVKRSVRSVLHDLVMEQVEQRVKRHPMFWFCLTRLFR